ncbi:3-ketodihydrosphingosine reductase tsc-10 [Xylariomycetidae sp. FL2044]|nr:3-ketodihydrosphingosine reductase tsc-10 [Xylariomycetidae sp. FL2044]
MGWFSHNHMPVEGRTILMIGGSEGTGLSAAHIFSIKGANVVIVSRNQAKLSQAIKSIKAEAQSPDTQPFHAIAAEVAEPGHADRVVAEATAWNDLPGSRASLARQKARPAAKHIIFTGSVLSTFSLAGHAPYAPTKFALCALADALVMEVRLYPEVPIEVHLVLPNSITTAGYEHENATKRQVTHALEGADKPQSVDEVAELAINGVEKGRYFITTAMGNSPRDNWIVDTVMAMSLPIIMLYVTLDMKNVVKEEQTVIVLFRAFRTDHPVLAPPKKNNINIHDHRCFLVSSSDSY